MSGIQMGPKCIVWARRIFIQELEKEAQACYKIGQLVLVNTEILDKYMESFRITDKNFYK